MRRIYSKHVTGSYTDDLLVVAASLIQDITGIQYGDHVYQQVVDDVLRAAWANGDRIPASRIMDAVARAMERMAYSSDLVGGD